MSLDIKAKILALEVDTEVENLGFSGTTLMKLWGIGIAKLSDLTAHDAASLQKNLLKVLGKGSASDAKAIVAEVEAVLSKRNASLDKVVVHEEPKLKSSAKPRKRRARDNFDLVDEHSEKPEIDVTKALLNFEDISLKFLFIEIRQYPLLSHAEHVELAKHIKEKGCRKAHKLLVIHNLRLVIKHARAKLWSQLDMADLMQEGILGLMKAAWKYDYERGFAFSTYATHWIKQYISRAIMDMGDTVRLPCHIQERINAIRRQARKENQERVENGAVELAQGIKALGLDVQQAKRIMDAHALKAAPSLDQLVSSYRAHSHGEETSLHDYIEDENALPPDLAAEAKEELDEACERINEFTEALYADQTVPERNREIMVRYYGLDGPLRPRTLEHVGDRYGITRERVRQIIKATWEKLQENGIDMDDDSICDELKRIRALEKLIHKRVSSD